MHKLAPRFFLGLSLGIVTLAGVTGCHKDPNAVDTAPVADNSGPDPADANMAPVDGTQVQPATAPAPAAPARVLGFRAQAQPTQSAEQYAPPPQQQPQQQVAPPPPDQ